MRTIANSASKTNRGFYLQVKLSPVEHKQLKQTALDRDMSISNLVRRYLKPIITTATQGSSNA